MNSVMKKLQQTRIMEECPLSLQVIEDGECIIRERCRYWSLAEERCCYHERCAANQKKMTPPPLTKVYIEPEP